MHMLATEAIEELGEFMIANLIIRYDLFEGGLQLKLLSPNLHSLPTVTIVEDWCLM